MLSMQGSGQMTLLSFGLQFRISWGSSNAKPAARSVPKELPAHPADSTISEYEIGVIQAPVVFGAVGETAIPDIVKDHLDDVAAILLQNPRIRISLVGHICNSGTETEGPDVGRDRANAVARYLVDKGVNRRRIDISYLQQSDPVLPNNPAANYRNRRVAVTVK
jgi:outer membrane protein OmpA-like peptidoglycan-associated protein